VDKRRGDEEEYQWLDLPCDHLFQHGSINNHCNRDGKHPASSRWQVGREQEHNKGSD